MLRKTARSNKRFAVITGLLVSVLLTVSVCAASDFTATASDGSDALYSSFITKQKVADLLENNISVRKNDKSFSSGGSFGIGKTKRIIIDDGKSSKEIYTTATYVKELIEDGSIVLTSEFDFLNVDPDAILANALKIEVTHVTSKSYKTRFDMPYKTVVEYDDTLPAGERVVTRKGENGIAENDVEVIYHNGVEFKKNITQNILKEKVDEIIKIGTKELEKQEPEKQEPTKREPRRFTATAYCACSACCGKSTGITATGTKASYGTVAVDPKVIPLGTKLYIEASDGSFVYGESVAADTGGAIKGNKVDLFFPTHSEALAFGRRTVNVYILD